MSLTHDTLQEIACRFAIEEGKISVTPFGHGHINSTYLVEYDGDGAGEKRLILQKVNTTVFPKIRELTDNMAAVTSFLQKKIAGEGGDPRRETLNMIPLVSASESDQAWQRYLYHEEGTPDYWRMFRFVTGASSYEQPRRLEDLYQSGAAFGKFQKMLSDFPVDRLYEVIPGFHDTRARYAALVKAVNDDVYGRADSCRPEIEFSLKRKGLSELFEGLLERGELPVRVAHNDTKTNNVMIDDVTGKGICVVDLDTVMPGLAPFDFGDAVRFCTNTALEDEPDTGKVGFSLERYRAFLEGFMEGCGGALTPAETAHMSDGAMVMTYEVGIRFLTDYLQGDPYFKTDYETHNLVRTRTQLRLLELMEAHKEEMDEIAVKLTKE